MELRYSGYVDMHRPDAWGYIVFGDETGDTTRFETQKDPSWPSRLAAMNAYYAQRAYHEAKEKYASSMSELLQYLDISVVDPFDVDIRCDETGYIAVVTGNDHVATVNQDRHLSVEHKSTGNKQVEEK